MDKKILIVQNSKDEWELFRDIFDLRGDKGVWVSDEVRANQTFLEGDYDMVLIEALLPKISGYELCRMMKTSEKGEHVPILLMGSVLQSFRVAHEVKVKYLADEVIVRPYDLDKIEKTLSLYLDGVELQRGEDGRKDILDFSKHDQGPVDYSKATNAIPFSGLLSNIPFPRVLAYFSFLEQSGTLILEDGKIEKRIVFKKGIPVSVEGAIRGETLGQIFLSAGKIDEITLENAIQTAIGSSKRFGEILIEAGAITPHDLYEAILKQAENKILEIFSWNEGSFTFSLDTPGKKDELEININVPELVVKGITQYWEDQALQDEFAESIELIVFPVSGGYERAQRMVSVPKALRLLNRINGKKQLKQIVAESVLERTETLQVLLALMILEAIVLAPKFEDKEDPPKIFKELGDRLVYDSSDHGKKYRETVNNTFFLVQAKQYEQMYTFDPKNPDYDDLQKQFDEKISNFDDQIELYRKSDALTRARVDFILERYSVAYKTLSTPENYAKYIEGREKGGKPFTDLLQSELEFRKGMQAFQDKEYEKAKEFFTNASNLHDNTAEYFAHLGYTQYLTCNEDDPLAQQEAIETIKRAIAINPHLDEPYLFIGRIHRDRKNHEKAEEFFEKTLEYNPRSIEALKELRKIFLERKLIEQKEKLQRPPHVLEFEHQITSLYTRMNEISFFELLESTEETDHDDLQKKYFDLSAKYRPNDIFNDLDEITQEKAEFIFQRLTDAYSTLIDRDARKEYIESLNSSLPSPEKEEIADTPSESLVGEAAQYYKNGRKLMTGKEYKNASLMFKRAYQTDSSKSKYQAYMAFAIYRAFKGTVDSHQAAVIRVKEMLRQLLQKDPNCSDCYVILAKLFYEEGKKLLAEEQVENALRVSPDLMEALKIYRKIHTHYEGKIRAKYLQKEFARIESLRDMLRNEYDKLLRKDYFDLLEVPRGSNPERVREGYQKMLDRFNYDEIFDRCPNDMRMLLEDIVNLMNKAFTVLSDTKKQEEYIEYISEKSLQERFDVDKIDNLDKIHRMGQIMIKEGLFDSAVSAYSKAHKMAPDNPQYHVWLAYSLFKAHPDDGNSRDAAKELLNESLGLDPDNPDAYWVQGKIAQHVGDDPMAVQLFRQALLQNPTHRRATLELTLRSERLQRVIASRKGFSIVDSVKNLFSKKKKKKKKRKR